MTQTSPLRGRGAHLREQLAGGPRRGEHGEGEGVGVALEVVQVAGIRRLHRQHGAHALRRRHARLLPHTNVT
eukprot:360789-Pyramimonas_sp.AAC.1